MMTEWAWAVGVLATATALSVAGTRLAMWLGPRWGAMAVPGGRRQHRQPVSRLGGLGVFAGFFGVGLGLYFVVPLNPNQYLPFAGVLLGTLAVFVGGLLDDKFEFKAAPQFGIQLLGGVIALASEVFIEQVTLPALGLTDFRDLRWVATYPLTLVWIVGMMNTVNFVDGLDGLAAGIGAITALFFAIHAWWVWQQLSIALFSLALAGACLGFLLFNVYPARVFLGSAGALTLGFALATLSILAPARVMTALMALAVPIADTAYQIMDRWRRGRSPFQGDRGHLHFRLADMGFSQRQIVFTYWLVTVAFGSAALLIPSPLWKLLALLALSALVASVLFWLSRTKIAD